MNPCSRLKYYRSLAPLLSADFLREPFSWSDVFGRAAPLELEIGFGNGEYLSRSARLSPERDFVGLEIAWPSVIRALRRLSPSPYRNVRLIRLPATFALERFFPPQSLSAVKALFPVPWPKEGQARRRLFSRAFLDLVAARLKPDGRFWMVTDDPTLAAWTLAEAEGSALQMEESLREASLDTKYERKWSARGRTRFFHLAGTPRGVPAIPPKGPTDMRPLYLDSLDPHNFRPQGASGDTTVIFREFLYDGEKESGLLDVKVVESSFIQEFFIRARKEPDGRWKLYPAHSSRVFPTEGVAYALKLLAGLA
ncbi:MAG: hypothetical protein LBO66_02780 [Deltaproteobacteria bacterium]|jgi:tRNA (guanine-N7-)-methyltransferase|nr:hypothetical protein [Deltaproteobacteria bacterium]